MTKLITAFTLFTLAFWVTGAAQPVSAQPVGCGATESTDGTQCILLRNTNNCPTGRGPVVQGTPPGCTCTCETTAPVLNTSSGPNFGNDCLGGNCGYPDSGLECGQDDQGRPVCAAASSTTLDISKASDLTALPAGPASGDEPPTLCAIQNVFGGIIRFALGFAGLALLIMFIMGGFKWLTAGTNEEAVQNARKTFIYAIVGLGLTIGAWYMLIFIKQITGIDVTKFSIPGCG